MPSQLASFVFSPHPPNFCLRHENVYRLKLQPFAFAKCQIKCVLLLPTYMYLFVYFPIPAFFPFLACELPKKAAAFSHPVQFHSNSTNNKQTQLPRHPYFFLSAKIHFFNPCPHVLPPHFASHSFIPSSSLFPICQSFLHSNSNAFAANVLRSMHLFVLTSNSKYGIALLGKNNHPPPPAPT
jgi:hypothetical protein